MRSLKEHVHDQEMKLTPCFLESENKCFVITMIMIILHLSNVCEKEARLKWIIYLVHELPWFLDSFPIHYKLRGSYCVSYGVLKSPKEATKRLGSRRRSLLPASRHFALPCCVTSNLRTGDLPSMHQPDMSRFPPRCAKASRAGGTSHTDPKNLTSMQNAVLSSIKASSL